MLPCGRTGETIKPVCPQGSISLFSILFPFFQFLIQHRIIMVPYLADPPLRQRRFHAAPRLAHMHAAAEPAAVLILPEFRIKILQFLFLHVKKLQGGKPRRIHNITFSIQCKQLRMAGGMPASVDLFADGAGLHLRLRIQTVDQRRFSRAINACKAQVYPATVVVFPCRTRRTSLRPSSSFTLIKNT